MAYAADTYGAVTEAFVKEDVKTLGKAENGLMRQKKGTEKCQTERNSVPAHGRPPHRHREKCVVSPWQQLLHVDLIQFKTYQ